MPAISPEILASETATVVTAPAPALKDGKYSVMLVQFPAKKTGLVKVYAPDPYRPQVKVVLDRAGSRLEFPYEVNLWEQTEEGSASTIVAPIDPASVGIDPLALL